MLPQVPSDLDLFGFVFEKESVTGSVASEPQKSARLHLPRAGITSISHHAQLFAWVLGIKWALHACITSSL